jgi:hypothetical protein
VKLLKNISFKADASHQFFDYQTTVSANTTVAALNPLDSLLSATGLLQQFPAHSMPVFQNGAYLLYRKIKLDYVIMTVKTVGSQSNALATGDLYNTIRYALFTTGPSYQNTNNYYLTTYVHNPEGNLTDVLKVLVDELIGMPSQAYYTSSGYNVPDVAIRRYMVPLNLVLDCYSTNASGVGVQWETKEHDLVFNYMSDSAVVPNPQMSVFFSDILQRPQVVCGERHPVSTVNPTTSFEGLPVL